MTLRYDDRGRPVGLDWAVLSANCPQDPSVWRDASQVKAKRVGVQLPDETQTLIVQLHRDGMAAVDIAETVGVAAPTVSAVLDRHEITENRGRGARQRTPEHVADRVVAMYVTDGMTAAEIREQIGISRITVYKILRRRNIEPRRKGTRPVRVAA